jgi:hypothetical protein
VDPKRSRSSTRPSTSPAGSSRPTSSRKIASRPSRLIDLTDGDVFTTANESDVPYGAKVKYVSPGVNEQVTVVDANDHELLTDHMHRTVYVVRSA